MSKQNPSYSILVVDDDVPLRKTIDLALRSAGHRVIATAGRDEVVALLESKDFDLVITDVLMPDIEGTEVIKLVREHQPEAAILAMSGGGYRITSELCLAIAGAMGAGVPLTKPFAMDELLKGVERAMASANDARMRKESH